MTTSFSQSKYFENLKVLIFDFSENGYYVATASGGNEIKIWDLRKLKEVKSIRMNEEDYVINSLRYIFLDLCRTVLCQSRTIKFCFARFPDESWLKMISYNLLDLICLVNILEHVVKIPEFTWPRLGLK